MGLDPSKLSLPAYFEALEAYNDRNSDEPKTVEVSESLKRKVARHVTLSGDGGKPAATKPLSPPDKGA